MLALVAQVTPQAASEGASASDVFTGLGMVLGMVIAGAIGIYVVRRRIRQGSEESVGFTLSDLREMRDAGDITDVEFNAARDRLVEQVKKQAQRSGKSVSMKSSPYTLPKKSRHE